MVKPLQSLKLKAEVLIAPKSVEVASSIVAEVVKTVEVAKETVAPADFSGSDKFFSPLVKNIAKEEGVSVAELESISGSGKEGRVTKEDILNFVENRKSKSTSCCTNCYSSS